MARNVCVARLFDVESPSPGTERFDVLFERRGVVIERITSSGSQPSQSFCQSKDEWVVLLRGRAELDISGERISLGEGDCILLPAGTHHEVVSTTENALWLAVHIPP